MENQFETDPWPFVPSPNCNKIQNKRKVRVIVIHTMEAAEKGDTAEKIALYFQKPTTKASAHICVDNNSIVQCVLDNNVAWAAPGANSDGIQIEMAGYAKQTNAEWMDPYSTLLLENAANATAQYCLKYSIPIKHITNAELSDNTKSGIVSHAQVSKTFKKSNHTDPGKAFPWDYFLSRVQFYYDKRKKLIP